ncbi:hypothetical protein PDPUS_2_00454 [Photobacterium damselae subsp. piscicida]|uniref:Uncharacterized protein n=1 Tax=Photobacterium damsela subsp. piscicida TaxID=38294 RepID=A0AAD1FPM1_PHODP|nr:hypothetical protein PDPUS_2_00454 [Photobacterium damselae subsp. piscicida]GAW46575.1 hypothetical protein PDPJ_2_00825 [Photobacterium damselae subsp. piscicida]
MEIDTLMCYKKSRSEYHCGTKYEWKIYQLAKVAGSLQCYMLPLSYVL